MIKLLTLVKLDTDYCNYLRKFDNRVPYNYNKKELRPFVGVLFEVNNYKYFAPLSSPKSKHLKLESKIDLLKIDDGRLGVVNFNNMLPVTDDNVIFIDLDKKCLTETEKKYMKLLKKQLFWLRRNDVKIYERAKKLYSKYTNGTLKQNIVKRCCDFKLLEEKCNEYNNILV